MKITAWLLRQVEAALTLVCSSLAISPLATCAGVEGLGREEIAALINKKLPTASSYSKATAGGWADNRYKTLQPYVNFTVSIHCKISVRSQWRCLTPSWGRLLKIMHQQLQQKVTAISQLEWHQQCREIQCRGRKIRQVLGVA